MKRDMVNNVLKAWTSRHASSPLFDYSKFKYWKEAYQLIVQHRSNMNEDLEPVGKILGTLKSVNDFVLYDYEDYNYDDCREDMRTLAETYSDLIVKDSFFSVVEVEATMLKKDFHNQGVGLSMYLNFAKRMWSVNGNKPFIFIPNYCNMGSTSTEARRVWASLARTFPSSGDCLAILREP
jgi:hypothetical protein